MMATVAAVRPMVSYRALELGAGPLEIGFIVSSFAILAVVTAVPIGRGVDLFGEKRFVVAGCVLVFVSLGITLASASVLLLAASQALLGLGQIITTIGSQTLIANAGSDSERLSRFSHYSVTMSFGQLVGPGAAGLLAAVGTGFVAGPTGTVFVAGLATIGVAALLALGLPAVRKRRDLPGDAPPTRDGSSSVLGVLRRPRMKQALFASATVLVSVDLLTSYLPIYGTENGLSVETVGLLLSLRAAASILSRLLMGRLIRAGGQYTVLAGSMIIAALGMVALGFVTDFWVLCLVMVVLGLGLGIGQPMTMAWVAHNATEHGRGIALAVRLTGNRLAQLVIPSIMGGVAVVGGVTGMFAALGVVLGLSALVVRVDRRAPPGDPGAALGPPSRDLT
jgi:MFS family permease